MPHIVKLDDFTHNDTTQNKYGKFEKAIFKKNIKLEDINKNGHIQLEYDINNNPYLEIASNKNSLVLTSNSIKTTEASFNNIKLNNNDLEETNKKMMIKIKYLEDRVTELEESKKIIKVDINEDFNENLYLIEFKNPNIGLFRIFKLNDKKEYLYICYYIEKNVSYWKLINNVDY
jgi:hypothetical protein